jgi:DNA-binding NarL/FixJ family response regulator
VFEFENTPSQFEPTEVYNGRRLATEKLSKLTKREIQVLLLIVAGLPNKVIAHNLSISQRTVENHRTRIIDKTGCKSLPALVSLVILGGKPCLPLCVFLGKCVDPSNDCPIHDFAINNKHSM